MNNEETVNSDQSSVISEDSLQSSDPSPQEKQSTVISEQLSESSVADRTGSVSDRLDCQCQPKTQGVRPLRGNGISVLQSAAKKAARSNSRNDVHEYMRIRRSFV